LSEDWTQNLDLTEDVGGHCWGCEVRGKRLAWLLLGISHQVWAPLYVAWLSWNTVYHTVAITDITHQVWVLLYVLWPSWN